MGIIIDARKASATNIENLLYISFNGLKTAVTYIYICLDVIGFTGLLEALYTRGYNLICNAATLQLNKQQDTATSFDDLNNKLATNVSSKDAVDVINGNDLCGSHPLNSKASLSKILSGMMCRVPSLREAVESGVGE